MTEEIIFKKLLTDSTYFSNVFGNITDNDFENPSDKKIYKCIIDLYTKYNKSPNINEMKLYFESANNKTSERVKINDRLDEIARADLNINNDILVDSTEKWVKNKRTNDLLLTGADFLDGNSKLSLENIQKMMEDINKLSFKKSAGLDYVEDAMKNFHEYTVVDENGIKSSLELVNIATGGGFKPGSLSIYAAISNAGKTIFLVNNGSDALLAGKNVAYFTFEETELEIRERFDARLMNKSTSEFKTLGTALDTSFQHLISQGIGTLKIKAYGPRSASVLTVKSQLEDWELKDGFKPDIVILDSITIIAPTAKTDNMYTNGKSVSEEAKALGVQLGIPVVSAIQLGRQSYGGSSVGMEDISESLAVAQVASTMIGIVLDEHRPDIRLISIIKSRKVNKSKIKSQNVNIDTDRQKIWDLTDNDSRTYVKHEQKEQLNKLNSLVDTASEVENGNLDLNQGSSLLDQLLSN